MTKKAKDTSAAAAVESAAPAEVRFTCRGPIKGTYTKSEAEAIGAPAREGHSLRGVKVREVKMGDKVIRQAIPCGADLTALIAAVPADGEAHEVVCPACGNKSSISRVAKEDLPDPAAG